MSEQKELITDVELLELIRTRVDNYKGDSSLLNEAAGLLIVGRIMGWEHQRLVASRSVWTFCTKVFGDPKTICPKRTDTGIRKSRALFFVDKFDAAGKLVSGYIDVVQGKIKLSMKERRELVDNKQ